MKSIAASGLAGVLREHFATEAADAGLRSSWGPMVDMAKSGITPGGRSTYEGSVTGSRYGFGGHDRAMGTLSVEAVTGSVSRHRKARAALLAMTARGEWSAVTLRQALYLAHGPESWPALVEEAYRTSGAPAVVLLTDAARRGYEKALRTAGDRRAKLEAMGIGEWLRSEGARKDRALVAGVCAEARDILAAAMDSFAAAWDAGKPARARPSARPRGAGRSRPLLPGDEAVA